TAQLVMTALEEREVALHEGVHRRLVEEFDRLAACYRIRPDLQALTLWIETGHGRSADSILIRCDARPTDAIGVLAKYPHDLLEFGVEGHHVFQWRFPQP